MVCTECNESCFGCGCVLPNLSLCLQLWCAWDGRGSAVEDSRHGAEHYVGSRKLVSAAGSVPRETARPWVQPCQGRGVNARCKLCHSKHRDGIKLSYLQNRGQDCPSSCLFGLFLQSPQACGLEVCSLHIWLSCDT